MNFFVHNSRKIRPSRRVGPLLALRVQIWEGDIDDSEQKCAAIDRFSLPLSPSKESLIVRYWLKHFLPTNSIFSSDGGCTMLLVGRKCFLYFHPEVDTEAQKEV